MELFVLFVVACVIYGGVRLAGPARHFANAVWRRSSTLLRLFLFFLLVGFFGVILEQLGVRNFDYAAPASLALAGAAWWIPKLIRASAKRRQEAEAACRKEAAGRAALATERQREADERRRCDARARCEAFFLRYGPELQGRFTREQLADFIARFMGDNATVAQAEHREAELLALMQEHVERSGRKKQRANLSDLITWFNDEKRKVEAMELAPDDEEQIIRGLEERFTRLQGEHIRQMQP